MVRVDEHELVFGQETFEAHKGGGFRARDEKSVVASGVTIPAAGEPDSAAAEEVAVATVGHALLRVADGGSRGAQSGRHVEIHFAAQVPLWQKIGVRAVRARPVVQVPHHRPAALLPGAAHVDHGAALALRVRDGAGAAIRAIRPELAFVVIARHAGRG